MTFIHAQATSDHQTVILRRDLTVDLLVQGWETDHQFIAGLRFRSYNDEIPVHFPSARLSDAGLTAATKAAVHRFCSRRDETHEIEASALVLSGDNGERLRLLLPLAHSEIVRTINIDFDRGRAAEMVVFEISNVVGQIYNGQQQTVIDIPASLKLSLTSAMNSELSIIHDTRRRRFAVTIFSISEETLQLTREHDIRSDTMRLISAGDDSARGRLVFHIQPIYDPSAKSSTPFTEAPLMIISYEPLPPTSLWWIACCPTGKNTFPLALPMAAPNAYPVPYMGFATSEGWFLGNHVPEGGGEELVLLLLGDPPLSELALIVRNPRYGAVHVLSSNPDYVKACRVTIVGRGEESLAVSSTGGKAEWQNAFSVSLVDWDRLDSVEEDLVRIASYTSAEPHTETLWRHHIDHRLPAVPIIDDVLLTPMLIVINMLRGRLPRQVPTQTNRIEMLLRPEKWLTDWDAQPITRSELLVGLIRRNATEYVAARAFRELTSSGEDMKVPDVHGDEAPGAEAVAFFEDWLFRWPLAGMEAQNASKKAFRSYLKSLHVDAVKVITAFARRAFTMETQERYAAGLTFLNPLVLVLKSENDYIYDGTMTGPQLGIDLVYLANYCGRRSRNKPGSVIPSIGPDSLISSVRATTHTLRQEYYQEPNRERQQRIAMLRRRLGEQLAQALDDSVTPILEHLGADRVISFSDVSMDLFPYGAGVLGMEVPVSRIPASLPLIYSTTMAIRHATRGQSRTRGGSMVPVGKATVLTATDVTDIQTAWSHKVGLAVAQRLQLLGLLADIPRISMKTKRSILENSAKSDIVIFFGHASASAHSAGLQLGEAIVSAQDIAAVDWSDNVIVLIGCETSAEDSEGLDLAKAFFLGGARAVVGTSAKVSVSVAAYFFDQFFTLLYGGLPIDYAFFDARRRSAFFETLSAVTSRDAAADKIERAMLRGAGLRNLKTFLQELGLRWEDVERHATSSLAFSLLGGAGDCLV